MNKHTLTVVTPLANPQQIVDNPNDILAVDAGILLVKDDPRVIAAIGDFDSMNEADYQMVQSLSIPLVKLNVIKDNTDLDEALVYGFDHGYQSIDVYGAIGKRIDHSFANILLLSRYPNHVHYWFDRGDMWVSDRDIHLKQDDYQRFSLFALTDSCISIDNALYCLDHYHLDPMDPLCISNQWLNQKDATITIHYGKLLVIRINENPFGSTKSDKGDEQR